MYASFSIYVFFLLFSKRIRSYSSGKGPNFSKLI